MKIFTFFAFLCLSIAASAKPPSAYSIGDIVADFSYTDINGDNKQLGSYKDSKGVILVFTCNTCPYAIAYEKRIQQLHKKYADKGFPVLAINPNDPNIKSGDNADAIKRKIKKDKLSYEYVLDHLNQPIYKLFGATRTPEIFLLYKVLGKNNEARFKLVYTGAIDDNYEDANAVNVRYVENAIAQLAVGKNIKPTYTRAIGCTIKR